MVRARVEDLGPGPVRAIRLGLLDPFPFDAGQYLTVKLAGGALPLSIASAPRRLPALHLLYQSSPADPLAAELDSRLRTGETLLLGGPFGDVRIRPETATAMVLVAAGTGAAQAFSVIDTLTEARAAPPVTFLWCAERSDRFVPPWPTTAPAPPWLERHDSADPTLGADNAGLRWLAAELHRLRDRRFLLCGSPGFVYEVTDLLTGAGIPLERLESDVFAYAPRV